MKRTYWGAVSGGDASFGIVFKDFPGCVSVGDTLEEVLEMGHEALQGHVEIMVEHGDPVPDPTEHTLEDVDEWLGSDEEEPVEPWVGLYPIDVEVPAYPERIAVTVKGDLVREIAVIASESRVRVERLIEEAARRELERLKRSA